MCLETVIEKLIDLFAQEGTYLFPKNEILLSKVLMPTYACGMSPIQDMTEGKNNSWMPPANVSVPTQSVP